MSSKVRRWKRVKMDIRVKMWRAEASEGAAMVVRSHELSEGGMSIYAPEKIETGTLMAVSFTLPGTSAALRLCAMVRNQHGFRYGLEFVRLSEAERAGLARYVVSVGESLESGSAADAAKA